MADQANDKRLSHGGIDGDSGKIPGKEIDSRPAFQGEDGFSVD
jgi:hypothetical protein